MEIFLKNIPLTIFVVSSVAANIALIYRLWFKAEVQNPNSNLEKDFSALKESFTELKTKFDALEEELEKTVTTPDLDKLGESLKVEIDKLDKEIKRLSMDITNLWKNKVEHITFKDEVTKLEAKIEKLQSQQFEIILQIKGADKNAR